MIVATDDTRIAQALTGIDNVEVCMTSADHQSGTDRLAEVCAQYQFADEDIIVNVQGDEPLIPPAIIEQVAHNLKNNPSASVATLSAAIDDPSDVFNRNVVKVVADKTGMALYFSRATIPWDRDNFSSDENSAVDPALQRHIGIYAYRVGFLKQYATLSISPLESLEKLEQLRVLWHGFKIHVQEANVIPPAGVDTREDLQQVIDYLRQQGTQ